MPNKNEDLQKLEFMHVGEEVTVNWFAESGGIVRRTELAYELYEVPLYGGKERYYDSYVDPNELLEVAYSWS